MNSLGPLAAVLSSLTWAVGASAYSNLSKNYSAFSVNLARASVAFPLFVLALWIETESLGGVVRSVLAVSPKQWGWFTLSILASYGLGDAFFLMSTRFLGVPGALAIASCYPIWTAILGVVFRGEWLTIKQMGGIGLSLVGILIVILVRSGSSPLDQAEVEGKKGKGLFLALIASGFWALNSLSISQASSEISPFTSNIVRMGIAWIMCLTLSRFLTPSQPIFLPRREFKKWGWVFAFEGFGGSFCFVYGLAHSTLAVGATLTSIAPVLSVPIALFLGLERFSLARTAGVILAVLGLSLLVTT